MWKKKIEVIALILGLSFCVGCNKSETPNSTKDNKAASEVSSLLGYEVESNVSTEMPSKTPTRDVGIFSEIASGSTMDFDGDGKTETITYQLDTESETNIDYTLAIGDAKMEGFLCNPRGKVYVGSMYKNDPSLQILIDSNGDSCDYCTYIFSFKNNQIYQLGMVGGLIEDIKALGDGMFECMEQGHTVESWFHPRKFYLSDGQYNILSGMEEDSKIYMPKVVLMPNEMYPIGTLVKLNYDTKLMKTQSLLSDEIDLEQGDYVTIVACDDEEWIYIENQDEVCGWLQMEGPENMILQGSKTYYSWEFFSGLYLVD